MMKLNLRQKSREELHTNLIQKQLQHTQVNTLIKLLINCTLVAQYDT